MSKSKLSLIIGIALVVIGLVLVFRAIPMAPLSVVGFEAAGMKTSISDISPQSAVALGGGVILIIIGAVILFKR